MYRLRFLRHVALGIDVDMKGAPGRQMVEQLHRADFNDAVALCRIEPGGFCIEDDFTHHIQDLPFALMSAIKRSTCRAVSARLTDVSIT